VRGLTPEVLRDHIVEAFGRVTRVALPEKIAHGRLDVAERLFRRIQKQAIG
jgi:hypothetical protein